MLVLTRAQVESLLDVDALIDALASAMADLSAGRASSGVTCAASDGRSLRLAPKNQASASAKLPLRPPELASSQTLTSAHAARWLSGSAAGESAPPSQRVPGQTAYQIATRTPSSTTRSLGIRKNSVAGTALRASTRKSHSRQSGIFGTIPGTMTSRPRK